MAKLKPYVLTIDDDSKRDTRVIMYGPFSSTADAAEWGNENCGDPRWNVIFLSKKRIGVNTLLVPIIKPITFGGKS